MTLRRFLLASVVLGVLAGAAAGGGRILTDDGGGVEPPPPSPIATPKAAQETPLTVAEHFAKAWQAGDTEAMYLLLDSSTRASLTHADFAKAYASFRQEATIRTITVLVSNESTQHITFHIRLETNYFGVLEYATVVPFNSSQEGTPRIAWTPAVMHPSLTDGRMLQGKLQKAARGAIYDRNGKALAITLDVRMIGLDRSRVFNRQTVTAAFVSFGFDTQEVDAAFESPLGQQQRVPLGIIPDSRVEEAARFVEAVPGAVLWFEERRIHPLGPASAHVVGYTREYTSEEITALPNEFLSPGDRVGAVGIEASMNTLLAGQTGARLEAVGGGEPIVLFERPYVPGKDIHTTLDASLLQAAQEGLSGFRGAAIVLDPRNNVILALNSSPSFDPNDFELGDERALELLTANENDPLNNRATQGLYSAGSTFKLITGAAGFENSIFRPNDHVFCGAVWYGIDPPRRNWEGEQGELTIAEGLMRSCNPVFYEIALRLYNEAPGALPDMARAFGFGAKTGIEGLYEGTGLVPDAAWKQSVRNAPWYPGDAVNLGIGQGDLLITPLQLANAYSAFLTGALRTPVILMEIEPILVHPLPLTQEHTSHLRHGLEMVTSSRGTAGWVFAALGYDDFGGKSGTAEEAEGQEHVLFVAYSPRKTPTAVAAVVFDNGKEGRSLAAPLARDLVLTALDLQGQED